MSLTCESPWGPIPVADAHVHFFSNRFFTALTAQQDELTLAKAGEMLGWRMPPAEPEKLAAEWIAELDRSGVKIASLIGSIPGDEASVVAAKRAYPDRFLAYAMVNPHETESLSWPSKEFAEIDAVCLFPAMHRFSMHADCVKPVFHWARENGRAVFVHCGVLSVGVRRKLGLPSPFDMRYSNPIDVQAVAIQYPEVPIIVPHFGAGYFRETLMLADLCPNVFLDTSSSNSWVKYHSVEPDMRHIFRHALSVVGDERLLFGTDSSFFPRGWHREIFEEQATALYEIAVSEHDARKIFGKNLLRIFRR